MGINEGFNKEIDSYEAEIESTILKLEMMDLAKETVKSIKEEYEKIRNAHYEQRLLVFTEKGTLKTEIMDTAKARYLVSLETDILPQIRSLHKLAICKQLAITMINNNVVNIDEIETILKTYGELQKTKFVKEKNELYDYLIEFFYKMIKRDAIDNNRFVILDLLYEYEKKGINFICGVSRLFLLEVTKLYKKEKNRETINLIKSATTDEFNKDDIVALLAAKGIKREIKDNGDTQKFNDKTEFEVFPYTDRIIWTTDDDQYSLDSVFGLGVKPLPTNEKDNLKLRKYDLSRIDYGWISGTAKFFRRGLRSCFENVNLSGTNAVVIPSHTSKLSIRGANLEGVDMRGVSLKGVDITDANLEKTGADITGSIGKCLGISPYEERKILISKTLITPKEFAERTKQEVFPELYSLNSDNKFDNVFMCHNRVLRQYDLSCVDYNYDNIKRAYEEQNLYTYEWERDKKTRDFFGLDFSYTNIDFNPKEFESALVLNLEGVDLRDKDFSGVEELFAKCNLKGTGAHISNRINPTVSPYIESSIGKTKR